MAMIRLSRSGLEWSRIAALGIFSVLMAGCGGGGGSSTPPPAGDFTVSASPTTLTLQNGQTQTITVSVAAINTFTSAVEITVSALPTGVTAAPGTFSLPPGGQQKVTLSATATVKAGTASVTFQGASGSLSHSSQVSLNLSYVPPDFSLSVTPASLSLNTYGSQNVTVSATGSNGFSSSVSVNASGLPPGVTATPATFTIAPGDQQQVMLAVGATATSGLDSVTFSGTSGSLVHSTILSLTLAAYHLRGSRWLRTDEATTYPYFQNQSWLVFDPKTRRIFEADPVSNRIMLVDAATQTKTGEIVVPGAFGIDLSPDGGTLWAGTLIGDVYAVDPAKMAVMHRYSASQIGPSGFQAVMALAMANGKLALLSGNAALAGVDGYGAFALWDPSDNSIVIHGDGSTTSAGCADSGRNFLFQRTGDRSLLILESTTLCTFDPVTGQGYSSNIQAYPVAPTPDGKSILVPQPGPEIDVLDPRTFVQKQTIPAGAAFGSGSASAMIVSADSKTVYVAAPNSLVYAYDLVTGQQVGWGPNPYVSPFGGGSSSGQPGPPIFEAQDNNGFLVGPMQEGVGFFDTQALQTGPPPGSGMVNDFVTPGTGPSSGGSAVKLWAPSNLAEILFVQPHRSPAPATGIQFVGVESQWQSVYSAVTPPGVPGVADVYGLGQDGSLQFVPEGFSYGPTILEATPNSATADGGGTGGLYGYGFGAGLEISTTAIPADLEITVGGKPATITSFSPNSYGTVAPPFQLMGFGFTIPSGAVGSSADITVTTSSGTATLKNGITYLPPVQQFPLNGAALAQGIYDSRRERYYFTDKSQIQVFSRTRGQWLNPIQLPAAPQGTSHRLWALALSPDGSKLAVTDTGTNTVYLIDPAGTEAVRSFSVAGDIPYGIELSDAGMIYVGGNKGFYKIDTNLASLLTYSIPALGPVVNDPQIRSATTADTSRVYFNSGGIVFEIDTATDTIRYTKMPPGGNNDDEFAFSSDNSRFVVSGYLCDSNLNPESYLSMNLRESLGIAYVHGAKLTADGALLFAPSPNGIDVFDGRLGIMLRRIALPVTLSQNYDTLVSDGTGSVLVAITGQTGNGVAVVDLSSIPKPSPLPYISATLERLRTSGAENSLGSRRVPKGGAVTDPGDKAQHEPQFRRDVNFSIGNHSVGAR